MELQVAHFTCVHLAIWYDCHSEVIKMSRKITNILSKLIFLPSHYAMIKDVCFSI